MQKIIARTTTAERQVVRRLKDKTGREKSKQLKDYFEQRSSILNEISADKRAAIQARHEDWDLGPLAPNRLTATNTYTRHTMKKHMRNYGKESVWGATSSTRSKLRYEVPERVVEARCAWAGGSKRLCLKEGDRVVVMEGHHKGKIAAIKAINLTYGTAELDDESMKVNTMVPDSLIGISTAENSLVLQEVINFPISAIRLVHPIVHNAASDHPSTRDVIIRELVPRNFYIDKPTRKEIFSRVVPGLNIEIPWPAEEEAEYTDHPNDTLRIDVEERTFLPTLLRPPMPEEVLNELRNQYSRFRTRHTEEYIREKEREAYKKSPENQVRLRRKMETPLQELNRKTREARKARGQPELSEEMLAGIGKVMADHQERLRVGMEGMTMRDAAVAGGAPPPAS